MFIIAVIYNIVGVTPISCGELLRRRSNHGFLRIRIFVVDMPPRKKCHGKGAVVSSLIRFIHPSEYIRNKFPNAVNGQWLDGCITVRQEVKKINRREQLSLVVTHEDFVDGEGNPQELHGVKKYWRVKTEGDQDYFFDVAPTSEETPLPLLPDAIETELDGGNDGGQNNLLVALTGVVDIDDDNEPAPENIPIANEENPSILEQAWGHDGICFHCLLNVTNQKARLHFPIDPTENDINLQLFEGLFPKDYLHEVILVETNKKLKEPLSYGELIQWIGIWVLLSTVDGPDRRSFWSSKDVDMYEGAPFRLSSLMTRNWFENILSAMMYTSNEPPVYVDQFWEVRQLIDVGMQIWPTTFHPVGLMQLTNRCPNG